MIPIYGSRILLAMLLYLFSQAIKLLRKYRLRWHNQMMCQPPQIYQIHGPPHERGQVKESANIYNVQK